MAFKISATLMVLSSLGLVFMDYLHPLLMIISGIGTIFFPILTSMLIIKEEVDKIERQML